MRAIPILWEWRERPKSLDHHGEKLISRKKDQEDSEWMNTGPKGWAKQQRDCRLRGAHGQCHHRFCEEAYRSPGSPMQVHGL